MSAHPVWIDLANSPHVLFFGPVLDELHRRGVPAVVTARDFAQTTRLCARFGIDAEVMGRHGGASLSGKAIGLATRVHELRAFARRERPAVAVSHNSYAQAVAARSLGVPVVTAMDYEFQPANHLAFRCADLVAVPQAYPLDSLRAQGGRPGRTWRYPGLKEHITLAGFSPDPGYLVGAGVDTSRPVVVVRPPADMALYHRFGNPLFPRLLERLSGLPVTTVLLARTDEQAAELEAAGFGALLWRGDALDGRQLVAGADAVVSAGGSMNREAAVLGTPAYSIYAGKLAAVDRALVASGRLVLLRDIESIERLELGSKPGGPPPVVGDELVTGFVDRLLAVSRR
jgi:predicted glycosyltransferase